MRRNVFWKTTVSTAVALALLTGCQAQTSDSGMSIETSALGDAADTEEAASNAKQETVADAKEGFIEDTSVSETQDWKDAAWAKFDEYSEPVRVSYDDFYEGYMDGIGNYTGEEKMETRFPALDYDGDGSVDRIYIHQEEYKSEVYLFSGNGEVMLIGKPNWYTLGETLSADLTGDGTNELIYISGTSGTGGESYYISIWEYKDGEWCWLDISPSLESGADEAGFARILTLTLQVEKLDSTHLRLTQRDLGISVEYEVSEDKMSSQWFWEDDKPHTTEIWSSGYEAGIQVLEDEETGTCCLQICGGYGDKWMMKNVTWTLIFADGEWKLLDFALK